MPLKFDDDFVAIVLKESAFAKFHVHNTKLTNKEMITEAIAAFVSLFPAYTIWCISTRSHIEQLSATLCNNLETKFTGTYWAYAVENRLVDVQHRAKEMMPLANRNCILFHLTARSLYVMIWTCRKKPISEAALPLGAAVAEKAKIEIKQMAGKEDTSPFNISNGAKKDSEVKQKKDKEDAPKASSPVKTSIVGEAEDSQRKNKNGSAGMGKAKEVPKQRAFAKLSFSERKKDKNGITRLRAASDACIVKESDVDTQSTSSEGKNFKKRLENVAEQAARLAPIVSVLSGMGTIAAMSVKICKDMDLI